MNAATPRIDVGDGITNLERVRRLRMQRHLAMAGLAGVACGFAAPAMPTLLSFAMLTVVVGVVLSSLARALDARLGYLWGWLYHEPEQSTRFDRSVDRIIHRLVVAQVDEAPVRVRPLDPLER